VVKIVLYVGWILGGTSHQYIFVVKVVRPKRQEIQ